MTTQNKLLNLNHSAKINVFSEKILETSGLPNLTIKQTFELSYSSAERSTIGCILFN